jgi:hypothetical protein
VTPLETLAGLLAGTPHRELAHVVGSLAAREEARIDSFWSDLAGPRVFGAHDSVASLRWDDPERERASQRALLLIAEDLELRGVASPDSSRWLERARSGAR